MSYYEMSAEYQSELQNGNVDKALKLVKKNKFLKKKRNHVLKLLEQGKLAHLNGDFKESNGYLNSVDSIFELKQKHVADVFVENFTNPEKTKYKAEDFEKVTIHYYKALNYYYLNNIEGAIVEAKRINLQLNEINDKYPADKKNRYKSDAFAHTLQGFLYEVNGDVNNAFIAYRNAANLYLDNNDKTYLGVNIPPTLENDVLRTASQLGFYNEVSYFEKKFNRKFLSARNKGGELILIWEKGLIPYKDQTYFTFHMVPQSGVNFLDVYNNDLGISFPIPVDANNKKSNYDVINVAFAKYESRAPYFSQAKVTTNNKSYTFEKLEDFDFIARKTLEDRRFREIAKAAARIATKKLAEYALKKENDNLGTVLTAFNALNEKADTRNWQTLPQSLNYIRIPLNSGKNNIKITYTGANGQTLERVLEIVGNGRVQIRNEFTF